MMIGPPTVYFRAFSNRDAAGPVSNDRAHWVSGRKRWLGKSAQSAKWSFCLNAAKMAAEQELR
jgi:hypothetical protein